jgi:hypothetical protein
VARVSARARYVQLSIEDLEERNLMSTILWTNRGNGWSDTDGFNAVFGANADTARAVVDAAILDWESIIQSFNYLNGGNTFSLTVSTDPVNRDTGAITWVGLQTDGAGKPTAGKIQLGSGNDGHGAGYFLDPNVVNSAAFQGDSLNPYARNATPGSSAGGLGDLFTVVAHEMTHALGFNSDANELLQRSLNRYLRNTGVPDAVTRPGTLFTFSGPGVNALLTSDDGGSLDTGAATHAAAQGDVYTDPATGQTYSGAVDLMNPIYLYGRRVMPSLQDALILADAYGYSVTAPAAFPGSSSQQQQQQQTIIRPPNNNAAPNPSASVPAAIVATGAAAGNSPYVQVYDAQTGAFRFSFYAYDPGFTGGVHVAVTKINGSPTIITAPGPGMVPLIRLFDGATGTLEHQFLAYEPGATVGVNVAVGDVNGDGYADIVTATASGNPHVKVFDGKAIATGAFNSANPDASLLAQFFAYGLNFNVGANIAVGDVNGDGYADIVTGASTGNPHVKVYSGRAIAAGTFNNAYPDASLLTQFFAYGLQFNIGANVAVGDVNGDGYADIVTGAVAGNPQVKVHSGKAIATGTFNGAYPDASLVDEFFAYGLQFNLGVDVAVADVEGDGYADIITGAPNGNPHVKIYRGVALANGSFNPANPDASLLLQFMATNSQGAGGVLVGAANFVVGAAHARPGACCQSGGCCCRCC